MYYPYVFVCILTSPSGNGTANPSNTSEPHEALAVCRAKEVPSFLSDYETLTGPAPRIEPTTSRSTVKQSIN